MTIKMNNDIQSRTTQLISPLHIILFIIFLLYPPPKFSSSLFKLSNSTYVVLDPLERLLLQEARCVPTIQITETIAMYAYIRNPSIGDGSKHNFVSKAGSVHFGCDCLDPFLVIGDITSIRDGRWN